MGGGVVVTGLRDQRRRLIAKVHVAQKELGLSEDNYRLILSQITGFDSCKDIPLDGLVAVIDRMKALGFCEKVAQKPQRILSRQKSLIRWLWNELYAIKAISDPSDTALDAWLKRQTGVDRIQWLTDAQAVKCIEALKLWKRRLERGQNG